MNDFRGADMQALESADRLAAKNAEIARLREAVLGSRPFVKLAVTQEQAEASARWHSKAMAALSAIDASLSSSVAPDPAEAMRAQCEAMIREESEKLPDSYVRSKKKLIHVADEIAALEKAQDSNDHYVGEFNRVMAERDSAYDERDSAHALLRDCLPELRICNGDLRARIAAELEKGKGQP